MCPVPAAYTAVDSIVFPLQLWDRNLLCSKCLMEASGMNEREADLSESEAEDRKCSNISVILDMRKERSMAATAHLEVITKSNNHKSTLSKGKYEAKYKCKIKTSKPILADVNEYESGLHHLKLKVVYLHMQQSCRELSQHATPSPAPGGQHTQQQGRGQTNCTMTLRLETSDFHSSWVQWAENPLNGVPRFRGS